VTVVGGGRKIRGRERGTVVEPPREPEVLEDPGCVFGADGPGKEKSLHLVATEGLQGIHLIVALHAFGGKPYVKATGDACNGADDGVIFGALDVP
jgi:hypothetical protein